MRNREVASRSDGVRADPENIFEAELLQASAASFFMKNPRNPYVQPVTRSDIQPLFPGCSLDLRRISLAPLLARALAPQSRGLCSVLSRLPLLCTHYLGAICKTTISQ